ncbi:hypothetical protein COZ13_05555 [Candidatus Desantisbacteria bacterium CG_4_10_14_3_um_filter_40_18]|uniref:O-antigen polymerase n=2 Tax=unclassified Candidatus Desantisiibacteriota TaxID=3106372 RepID=A0A2M7P1D9_9BACT|nr:MAG: hypothetical protein COZ13_05555 [Candidatus Desantisbacteria bacterium CG_4_10_14_3_um_filter_40_18]
MIREKIFGEKGVFPDSQNAKIALMGVVGVALGLCVVLTENWRMSLLIILLLITIVATFQKPYIGVLFFIFLVYFPPEQHGINGGRVTLIATLFLLVAWLIRGIGQKKLNAQWSPQLVIIGMLSLWMFIITQTAHISVPASWEGSIKFFKVFIFCFLLASLIDTKKKLFEMLAVNLFGITYFSLNGFHSFLFQGDVRGIGGICSDTNSLAHFLVLFCPMTINMLIYPNKLVRLWGWFLLPMQLITIIMTNSRGGAIGLAIVMVWMLLQALIGFKWKLAWLIGLSGILILYVVLGTEVGKKYTQRVETVSTYQKDEGSAMKRIYLWQAGLEMIRDHPITGVGMENFILTFPEYNPYLRSQSPHNTYVQFGTECGIPGLGLYLLLLFFHFNTLLWIKKRVDKNSVEAHCCLALEAGALGHMVHSIFISKVYFEPIYWLIISGSILKKIVKQEKQIS